MAGQADRRSANRVPSLMALDSTDATKVVAVKADPATGKILTDASGTGVNMYLSGTALKDDTQFGDGVTTGIASTATRLWNGSSYDRLPGSTFGMRVEEKFSFSNITSATTTTVKSGAGLLHAITVNSTAAGTITIYDNTAASGTKIGIIKASVVEQTFTYNVSFGTGLTIVTGAASDITVSYR